MTGVKCIGIDRLISDVVKGSLKAEYEEFCEFNAGRVTTPRFFNFVHALQRRQFKFYVGGGVLSPILNQKIETPQRLGILELFAYVELEKLIKIGVSEWNPKMSYVVFECEKETFYLVLENQSVTLCLLKER